LAALLSGGAYAGERTLEAPPFENHLESPSLVSPAQLYQIQGLRTDYQIGYTSDQSSRQPQSGAEVKGTTKGTNLFAAAIYDDGGTGLRAGATAAYMTRQVSIDALSQAPGGHASGSSQSSDVATVILTPTAALPFGHVVVGAAYDFVQDSKTLNGTQLKPQAASYGTFRPGVVYANAWGEVGAAYSSYTKLTAGDGVTTVDVIENVPTSLLLHGRCVVTDALDHGFDLGLIAGQQNWSGIDPAIYKDRQLVKVTSELRIRAVKMEADLGFATADYKGASTPVTPDMIGTTELDLAGDYAVAPDNALGGSVSYSSGSGGGVAATTLAVAVRGVWRF
jgi:hypothetical protein